MLFSLKSFWEGRNYTDAVFERFVDNVDGFRRLLEFPDSLSPRLSRKTSFCWISNDRQYLGLRNSADPHLFENVERELNLGLTQEIIDRDDLARLLLKRFPF